MKSPFFLLIVTILLSGCFSPRLMKVGLNIETKSGKSFYESVIGFNTEERESVATDLILQGNIPAFLKKLSPVRFDTVINGKSYKVKFFVTSDYLSIGNNKNFARVPLTPIAAQLIADSFNCFLPTRKMVDLIYKNVVVKPEPVPMYAFRDSSVTMYQHHLMIEGQRKLQKGIIAGIKKDVVITSQLIDKPRKVAIYGWHYPDGKPIQPLFTGHVDWYVDYSHGIRLVYQTILVNGKKYHFKDILQDEFLKHLLCDEPDCTPFRYEIRHPYK